ncbi:MAG: CRISPR-associated helicase Cas3' [Chloroflexota bacterium]
MLGYQPGKFGESLENLLTSLGVNILSHPQKALSQHLRGVYQNSAAIIDSLGMDIDEQSLILASLLHDIYKADDRFQRYLANRGKGVHHAQPSACFALLFARQHGFTFRQAILPAEVIRRHHTYLKNFSDIETAWKLDNEKLVSDLSSIDRFFSLRWQPREVKDLREFFFDLTEQRDEHLWFDLRLLYSVLIAADRMDACGRQYTFSSFPTAIHPFTFEQGEINTWRTQLQQECYENALQIIIEPGVYSLTLPTGAGKTLAGLKIASALINKFEYKSLIYTLPFISIVEQTTQTAKDLYGEDQVQEDHSLRPIDSDEDDKDPLKRMADLFRYWYSPIVLTTMVQFWEAIFAPQANRSMNFHRFSKAVVILDEPQTIPIKYWEGLGEILQFLSKKMGTIFILMTATQPHIYDKKAGRKETAPRPYKFPQNRHHYQIIDLNQSFEISKILEVIEDNHLFKMDSGLVVLNTRKAALQTFDLIKSSLPSDQIHLRLLSTWLTPRHRKQVLADVKKDQGEKRPMLLVSTQVVEAGVDLDFDWVFRDFGPLDSIVQVGGRCNRHAKRSNLGMIFVANLQSNGRKFANSVYDKVLLEATRTVLINYPEFDEDAVSDLISKYYHDILASKATEDLLSEIRDGKWGENRPLFEDRAYDQDLVSMIIEENEKVPILIKELIETIPNLENIGKRKTLMQDLQQYIIQVPQKSISSIKNRCSQIFSNDQDEILGQVLGRSFYYLRNDAIGEKSFHTYHPIKGFIPPEESEEDAVLMY